MGAAPIITEALFRSVTCIQRLWELPKWRYFKVGTGMFSCIGIPANIRYLWDSPYFRRLLWRNFCIGMPANITYLWDSPYFRPRSKYLEVLGELSSTTTLVYNLTILVERRRPRILFLYYLFVMVDLDQEWQERVNGWGEAEDTYVFEQPLRELVVLKGLYKCTNGGFWDLYTQQN